MHGKAVILLFARRLKSVPIHWKLVAPLEVIIKESPGQTAKFEPETDMLGIWFTVIKTEVSEIHRLVSCAVKLINVLFDGLIIIESVVWPLLQSHVFWLVFELAANYQWQRSMNIHQ